MPFKISLKDACSRHRVIKNISKLHKASAPPDAMDAGCCGIT